MLGASSRFPRVGRAPVKKALAKGILVSVYNEPLCVPEASTGPQSYFPGTLNYIGGDETPEQFTAFIKQVYKMSPGSQDVLLVVGTPGFHQTIDTEAAAKAVEKAHPEWRVTTLEIPTYDLAGAQKACADRLTADKGVTVLATNYSDMTEGCVLAMQELHYRAGVKVYDMGGSTWAFKEVRAGVLQMTSVYLPKTETADSVQSIYNAWYGKSLLGLQGYVNILKSIPSPFISKANIGSFTAQY